MKILRCQTYLLIVLLVICFNGYAQTDSLYIDSLKKVLLTQKEDTNKVHTLVRLYNWQNLFDTTIINEGLKLSRKLHYSWGEAENLNLLGQYYLVKTNEVKALENFQTALAIFKKIGDNNGIISTLNSYAVISGSQNDFRKALELFSEAEESAVQIRDSGWIAELAGNIGRTYERLGNLDSAEIYLQKAKTVAGEINDSSMLAYEKQSLGGLYLEKKDYKQATDYLHESIAFYRGNNNNFWLPGIYTNLAKVHMQTNGFDSAFYYANKALDIGRKNPDTLSALMAPAEVLSQLYEQQNDYKKAIFFLKLFNKAKDSSLNQEKTKKLSALEFQEKEKEQDIINAKKEFQNKLLLYISFGILLIIVIVAIFLFHNNKQQKKSNKKIEKAYTELKSTQSQLIQSEKMASLGELTAGIAHEIQNPLNFVNNFSDVNQELLSELKDEADKGNIDEVKAIANDVIDNEQKINHHGKRADAIVKGMLQHSRKSSGQKESTDINALCDEYLRLSYHGMRAKDKNFNADFKKDFDESIEQINIVGQDISRVLLNLFNNAFYAVNEKRKNADESYKPIVIVQTKKLNDKVEITVTDNGNGIPQNIIDKIFQPFFTTKPTGEGTGLGLSLAYDIITKEHNGTIKAESKEAEGTMFKIYLPAS